jgi:hypothetical protein
MPFLRFTRDKRGYEHFQLVQPGVNRRGAPRPRILYLFRSPPNVRVGGKPFDDAARAALERHNPGVEFDWTQILATPIPSAEGERWRERRRHERAARQFASDETPAEDVESENAAAAEDAGTHEGSEGDARSSRRNRRRRRGRRRPTEGTSGTGTEEFTDSGALELDGIPDDVEPEADEGESEP